MMTRTEKNCTRTTALARIGLWGLFIGVSLYVIIATPDEGGIWDGYVPTWLGGEGRDGEMQ
jgi:hypothetical protein